ncbi:MAG: hypothetical protein ACI33J_04545 [Clostridium sp.]
MTINDVHLLKRTIVILAEINKGRKDKVVFYGEQMSKLLQRWFIYKNTM